MNRRFLLQIFILTLLSSIGIAAWNKFAPLEKQLNALWLVLTVILAATIVLHYTLTRSTAKKTGAFVITFMAVTLAKLFLFIVVIILYCFFNRQQAVVFIMGFLILYLTFTTFEIIALYKFLKKDNSTSGQTSIT